MVIEILVLTEIQHFLQPLEVATNEISSQSYTKIILAFKIIYNLYNNFFLSSSDHEISKVLKAAIIENRKTFLSSIADILINCNSVTVTRL